MTKTIATAGFFSLLMLGGATVALADDQPGPPSDGAAEPDDGTGTPGADAAPDAPRDLPESQSDDDIAPKVAAVGMPEGGLVRQAGIGGVIGYGRAGVMELGGSAGFAFASDYRELSFAPMIGYFVADNLEMSGIVSVSNIKADAGSATLWSALAEPSYHVPFNRSAFGFAGLGVGASHVSGLGTGFALAPRLGLNLMVGRSAVLTPAFMYQYTTINSEMNAAGTTVVALTSAVKFNVSFTAMW